MPRFEIILGKLHYLWGDGGGIREKVSYGVANCALGYFGVLILDPEQDFERKIWGFKNFRPLPITPNTNKTYSPTWSSAKSPF